jgi:hypothetical protein
MGTERDTIDEVFMTEDEAEEIVMACEVGRFDLDYPGNRSKLAHACLLFAHREQEEE